MSKHPGGRPLKFKTVQEMKEKIDAYFADCDPHLEEYEHVETIRENGKFIRDEVVLRQRMSKQKPYTITGLALALGTTRDLLLDYEEKDEFSDTIKEAKAKCHMYAESKLFEANATGPIFNLKNNYGWKDRTEVDNNLTVGVEISERQAEQLIRARAKRSDT